MEVAILTVGNEILAGDIQNTNTTWLAREVTDRGDAVSRTLYTPQPEKSMLDAMVGVRERFDVAVGSYPAAQGPHRLKVTGTDERTVDEAIAWLRERVETLDVR